ncbi:hypothetical protein FHX15_000755 [Rhizobium sp. BK650]|nr:hypothetical protein [Rhizobium sp. BK650]
MRRKISLYIAVENANGKRIEAVVPPGRTDKD